MTNTDQSSDFVNGYLDEVFGGAGGGSEDEFLSGLMPRAVEAGIPAIAVSASVGQLLLVLVKMIGAKRIVEVGTLAGYSGIWMARGMDTGGQLITVEFDEAHAAFSRRAFDEAGVGEKVDVRRQAALDALPEMLEEFGEGSVDLVFLDAVKTEYPEYLKYAQRLLRPGGLLVADNTLSSDDWKMEDPAGSSDSRDAVDLFNREVAGNGLFDACCVPLRMGVMIARKR